MYHNLKYMKLRFQMFHGNGNRIWSRTDCNERFHDGHEIFLHCWYHNWLEQYPFDNHYKKYPMVTEREYEFEIIELFIVLLKVSPHV